MSYFLWVEDFDNNTKVTASNVLGGILNDNVFDEDKRALKKSLKNHGVFIELNFQDGLEFITSNLNNVDYIILDIDLPAYDDEINDEVLKLLETFEGYKPYKDDEAEDEERRKKACKKLKEIAGFHLYTKLVVDLGFPKQHILFCSNHADEMKIVQKSFQGAKINLPNLHIKSDDDVKKWVKERHENPYSILRRGIIEGCRYLRELSNNKHRFSEFIHDREKQLNEEVLRDYLKVLEKFLPLREPEDKAALYKLFIRTLAHEWESAHPAKFKNAGLPWIMKNTRNWSVHNSTLFNEVDEKLLAYLFFINMRLMFEFDEEVQSYERILLNLISDEPLDEIIFVDKANNRLYKKDIAKVYLVLKNSVLDEKRKKDVKIIDGFYFNELANNIQQSSSALKNDAQLFTKILFQMFWLVTSNPYVSTGNKRDTLEIEFWNYNYLEKPYIKELARHIYKSSFPEA